MLLDMNFLLHIIIYHNIYLLTLKLEETIKDDMQTDVQTKYVGVNATDGTSQAWNSMQMSVGTC